MLSKINSTSTIKLNSYLFPLMYLVFSVVFEILQFLWLGFGVFPKYLFLDLGIILVISAIIFILPNNISKNIVMYFFLTLQFILNITNITLYKVFGDILSFDMLLLGAEATTAFSFQFIDFFNLFVNIALFAISIAMGVLVTKNVVAEVRVNRFSKISILMLIFCLINTFGFGFYSNSFLNCKYSTPFFFSAAANRCAFDSLNSRFSISNQSFPLICSKITLFNVLILHQPFCGVL